MFAIIIIVIAVFVVLLLFAIPYFAVTKKPEVQEYASYTLDEVKDKDDEKQQKMQLENSRERYKKRGKARR
jgi:uncharacterized protein YpmB